jgi:hypothetical protein
MIQTEDARQRTVLNATGRLSVEQEQMIRDHMSTVEQERNRLETLAATSKQQFEETLRVLSGEISTQEKRLQEDDRLEREGRRGTRENPGNPNAVGSIGEQYESQLREMVADLKRLRGTGTTQATDRQNRQNVTVIPPQAQK